MRSVNSFENWMQERMENRSQKILCAGWEAREKLHLWGKLGLFFTVH
jgi:hypothetical protein